MKRLEVGYRVDMLVEDKEIIELKSVERVAPVHKKPLLTYLRLSDKRLGLLINFGSARIKNGNSRVVNRLVVNRLVVSRLEEYPQLKI